MEYSSGKIRLLCCRSCTMVSGDSIPGTCRKEYPHGIGSIDCGMIVVGYFVIR